MEFSESITAPYHTQFVLRWEALADCDLSVSSECKEDDSEISHTLFVNAIKRKLDESKDARHSSFLPAK